MEAHAAVHIAPIPTGALERDEAFVVAEGMYATTN
jgi:hypothetical protein